MSDAEVFGQVYDKPEKRRVLRTGKVIEWRIRPRFRRKLATTVKSDWTWTKYRAFPENQVRRILRDLRQERGAGWRLFEYRIKRKRKA